MPRSGSSRTRIPPKPTNTSSSRPSPVTSPTRTPAGSLAAGASAEVFEYDDFDLGRTVAVKVFTTKEADRVDVESFRQECQALGAVSDHPAIVTVHGSGVLADGRKGEYVEYAAAEQATMAISAIINAMGNAGYIDGGQLDAMNKAAEGLYDAVAKDEEYKPQGFVAALTKFQASVPK